MTLSTNPGSRDGIKAVEDIDGGRRSLFGLAAALPLLALGLGSRARAADAPVCFNPATLTGAQKHLRDDAKFRQSTDPMKRCGVCTYFTASTVTEGCGKCRLLLNGPVSAENVCNSWTKKA